MIDNEDACEDLDMFLSESIPSAAKKLTYFQDPKPIFDEYGIEIDIGRALANRVELPSGGYLIIEQTEALTSCDVNTGRFVGKANAQDTIFKTNMEAVDGIVRQLQVRNIGGIIVLDFIDMESMEHRERVYNKLCEQLKSDRARTNVLRISELGLVQMTRKRTSESLERQLMEDCPHCQGTGHVRTMRTEAYDLLREILRVSLQTHKDRIQVKVRNDIQNWILEKETDIFNKLKREQNIEVEFVPSDLSLDLLKNPAYEVM